MAEKLDPQLLAQILGLQGSQRAVDNGATAYWYDPSLTTDDPNGYILSKQYGMDFAQGDGGENVRNGNDLMSILKLRPDTAGKLGDMYDIQGNPLGTYEANSGGGRDLNSVIGLMAAGYFGGNALAGANAGGSAGLTGIDAAMADAAASGSLTPGAFGGGAASGGIDLVAGSGLGADVGSLTGGSALTTGGGSALGGLGSAGSALGSLGLNGSTLGGIAGAVAGAIDSKDKTQTTSRDPWAPAQDFLKQRLADGSQLATQYKAQPFSPAQQTAYGNVGGLVDLVNSQLPGLLAGMNANASGQNQFVRGQRPTLTGATFNPAAFQPAGLLGYMGSK